jgi:hypothetical protein
MIKMKNNLNQIKYLLLLLTLMMNACGGGSNNTTDEDSVPLPVLSISDSSETESNSAEVAMVFEVSLDKVDSQATSFTFSTLDASAVQGVDYIAQVDVDAEIPAGVLSTQLEVLIKGDVEQEITETFLVRISNLSSNAEPGVTEATGTIIDNDTPVAPGSAVINDTGVTGCSTTLANHLACSDSATNTAGFPGQDGQHGHDAVASNDTDGRAGFSFTKLDATGDPLVDQTADYAVTPWHCVRDEITGLVWEVKTDDGGLQHKNWLYYWRDIQQGRNCGNGSDCLVSSYVESVNNIAPCGYSDWRLPDRGELLSLVDYGSPQLPHIDSNFFPNSIPYYFWTADADAIGFRAVSFKDGVSRGVNAQKHLAIRLLRGGL